MTFDGRRIAYRDVGQGSPLLSCERFDRLIATEGRSGVPGDAETWAWAHHAGFDLHAMRALVAAMVPTTVEELRAIDAPVLVAMGSGDHTVGSGEGLAALLGRAAFAPLPGDHVQAGLSPEFGEAVAKFVQA